jgi:hypothetical protein
MPAPVVVTVVLRVRVGTATGAGSAAGALVVAVGVVAVVASCREAAGRLVRCRRTTTRSRVIALDRGWTWIVRTVTNRAARARSLDAGAGCAARRTVRCSDDGGAVGDRPGSLGVPRWAAMPTTVAMAPVISAAARTRAQVSLMFVPPSVDTSIKGSIGIRESDLRGSCG